MEVNSLASTARLLWQRFRWPLILLLVYLLAEQLFVSFAVDDGLFFPSVAGGGWLTLALGLLLLGLRLIVYVLMPGIVTYKLVGLLWDRG